MIKRQQVAVGGAIFNQNDEVLFVRRHSNDSFLPGMWELPGGGTEFGETPEIGLEREILEECSVKISIEKPVAVFDYYLENNTEIIQRIEIIYICKLDPNQIDVKLSEEHDKYVWRKIDNIEDLQFSEFMEKIVESVKSSINHKT